MLSLLLLLAQQELQPIQATEMLAIGPLGRTGRIPFPTDPIQLLIVLGKFQPPADGEEIKLPDGRAQTWRRAKAAEDEWFSGYGFQSGYARWTVDSPASRIALLEANGHGMVYANGEPRAGDPYGYGYVRLPVLLKKGQNEFLFATGRGRLSAKLAPVAAPYLLNTDDPTLPDAVAGKKEAIFGAVVLINATGKPSPPLSIEASWSGRTIATRTPSLPPLSTRKIRFNLPDLSSAAPGEQKVQVHLSGNGARHDSASVSVRVRRPDETRKITFVSDIDGSVQYYAIRPPQKQPRRDEKLPIVLSLHGASVEAINQADAYSPKDWCWIVCPTNRRPFGFDWEDWGRLDALEVLRHAQKHLNADFSRTYLTGHSMGGHGTWQLGVLYPDLFLAIAPSAGWRSFFTYGGKPRLEENATDIDKILARATASSDTEALSPNLIGRPVYILHGDADDNVPVTEARAMRDLLTKLGQPPGYHEQKGAGHWWDGDASPGADCVDWPAIFETFRKTPPTWPKRAEDVKVQRSFYVIDPSIWNGGTSPITVLRQERKLEMSSITMEPFAGRLEARTNNVSALQIHQKGDSLIDGQRLSGAGTFVKENGSWRRGQAELQKGAFKSAFNRRFALVYGTRGTPEENALCYAKARFDAESFWYRGNGAPELIADSEATENRLKGRNVILYGNQEINTAWQRLLKTAKVFVSRGSMGTAASLWKGEDLTSLFVEHGQGRAVAGVGATGVRGLRLMQRLPYFVSGVGYPDWCVFDSSVLENGVRGVREAGYRDEL